MKLYFAPLEGVTDIVFRRAHFEMFGGIDKYFIPFISPTRKMSFSARERSAFSPTLNQGIPTVPQTLTKDSDMFNHMAEVFRDAGYDEVNLNIGCPSGTVTAKGKGSGLLRDIPALKNLLDGIFAHPVLPISVKTRIGFDSPDEWGRILEVYAQYPVKELIVHPRVRNEFYKGTVHEEAYSAVTQPMCLNGDIFTVADIRRLEEIYPNANIMLGRGIVANPALARAAKGGGNLTKTEMRAFHDRLYADYCEKWPKNAVLGHMHEFMYYFGTLFENAHKQRKLIRKAVTLAAYESAVERLFDECVLGEEMRFNTEEM